MFLWVLWKQAVLIEERDLISSPMERKAAVKAQLLLDIKESTWERGVPDRGKSCSGNWQLLDSREFNLKTCICKKWVFISAAHKAALIFFFFLIIYIPISYGCSRAFPWLFQRSNEEKCLSKRLSLSWLAEVAVPHPVTLEAVSGWCCVVLFTAAQSSSGWADPMPGSPGTAGSSTADWGEEDIKCSPVRCCMECWEAFLFIQLHVIPMSKAWVQLPHPPLCPGLKGC